MPLPHALVEQVRQGGIFLVLGAGAAKGALHPQGKSPPDGQQLADMLATAFLGTHHLKRPLDQVAQLAISETSLVKVQTFIADVFRDFQPAAFHKLIPTFVWAGIATTNYDLIVERAYEAVSDRLQVLEPFLKDGERIEERLRDSHAVPFIKLHGCVSRTDDPEIPMILTPEQYLTHRKSRGRLFDRLKGAAYETPILFVGHSLADIDLRAILLEITSLGDSMPRCFLVAPHISAEDERYWASRKITCIKQTFETFLSDLSAAIPPSLRQLAIGLTAAEHPIAKRFQLAPGAPLPSSICTLLSTAADYVHAGIPSEAPNPKLFYRGHFSDWSPTVGNLDIRRSVTDTLISETILPGEDERTNRQELFVVKGHAGSGKTVLLHRLAWEAATEFDQLCLFVRGAASFEYDALFEIARLSKQRVFLFFDPASDHRESIQRCLSRARTDRIPLTVITADRNNEWNYHCESLEGWVTATYELRYLNESEIDELLVLLERYKSLGHLESQTRDARRKAFAERAGRNLLVALHEATLGKPFSDIIYDEYTSIPDEAAKILYRTVCILHRLDVPTRAGLLARVHGIPFTDFKERLFKPLETVVFARKDDSIREFVYRSRHSHIATIVFERVLTDADERYDEYIRIIDALDVDYEADRAGLRGLVNGRELSKLFPSADMIRSIFERAKRRDPSNAMILQQESIFEMEVGEMDRAAELLRKARALKPGHTRIEHSIAELSLKRAQASKRDVEKKKFRDEARSTASSLIARGASSAHPYHTLFKIGLDELEEVIGRDDGTIVASHVKDLEKLLADAFTKHPGDSFLLDAEAQLSQLIGRHPNALVALKKAFNANRRSGYLAGRLSRLYELSGETASAVAVLKDCLEVNNSDKEIHFRLGMLLQRSAGTNSSDVIYHLRNAFTPGDGRYVAQFWYARAEYLANNSKTALSAFKVLGEANIDVRERRKPQGAVSGARFYGVVDKIDYSYAFIAKDGDGSRIYTRVEYGNEKVWPGLSKQNRVSFGLAFNYYGPCAMDVRREGGQE